MVCSTAVVLDTRLDTVTDCLMLHKSTALCAIYVPPSSILTLQELDTLVWQLPSPYLLNDDCGKTFYGGSGTTSGGMTTSQLFLIVSSHVP